MLLQLHTIFELCQFWMYRWVYRKQAVKLCNKQKQINLRIYFQFDPQKSEEKKVEEGYFVQFFSKELTEVRMKYEIKPSLKQVEII